MKGEIDTLLAMPEGQRKLILAQLMPDERMALDRQIQYRIENPWLRFQGDPTGFVRSGLGEAIWSKQDEILQSLVENRRTAVPACHAPGKAMASATPVFTPTGWRIWGDVQVGDPLFSEDGETVHVTGRTPIHTRPYYRVTFDDGSTIDVSDNHRWVAHNFKTRHKLRQRERHHGRTIKDWRDWWDEGIELTTEAMAAEVLVPNGKHATASNWSVPLTRPLQFPAVDLPRDPYTLGIWLAEGCRDTGQVTLNKDDAAHIIDRMREGGTGIGMVRPNESHSVYVGLLGWGKIPKRIPREYFTAGVHQREALLHGLMDGDGWAGKGTNVAALGFSNRDLFEDALELVRGLGYAPRITSKTPKIGDQEYGEHWTMSWHYDRPVFTLPRYGTVEEGPQQSKGTARYITSIEPIGIQEGMCVQVDSPRKLYVAGEQHVVTHNTHLAARAIAYWCSVHPIGTARVITTAPTGGQARGIMWPHVRRLQAKHKLPGYTNSFQWRAGTPPEILAEAIKPADDNEAGMQGYHAPYLLILVDEAGGISNAFGKSLEALMTGPNTRLLLLGNPPTDDENTWFERACSKELYNTIPISALDTPNWTGEFSGYCKSCPPEMERHEVSTHLIDQDYAYNDIRDQYGEDSAMYLAKVLAQFPRDNTAKVLPVSWLERARDNMGEDANTPGRISLGVDIASDGGDEFVIAKLDGWTASIAYANAGAGNEDATQVAGKVLHQIREAEKEHAARGIKDKVRVKLDAIGLGWGVVSMLNQWGKEGKHNAVIVPVNVAERARDSKKFLNQRAELWWSLREVIHPPKDPDEEPLAKLDMGHKELAQLNAPTYTTNSTGRIVIEAKDHIKKRGLASPDRAEAILLAFFEPPVKGQVEFAPVALPQSNVWGALG